MFFFFEQAIRYQDSDQEGVLNLLRQIKKNLPIFLFENISIISTAINNDGINGQPTSEAATF